MYHGLRIQNIIKDIVLSIIVVTINPSKVLHSKENTDTYFIIVQQQLQMYVETPDKEQSKRESMHMSTTTFYRNENHYEGFEGRVM